MILQQLQRIQSRHGYLPRAALAELADSQAIPLYRIQEVASFYPHFRDTPPPDIEISVCRDMSCQLRGSWLLLASLERELNGEMATGSAAVCAVSCLGRCDRAPAARLDCHRSAPADHEHAPLNFFGRQASEIAAAARDFLAGKTTTQATDTDADLPDASAAWTINLYAGQPVANRYATLRRVIDAIRRGPTAGDAERDRIIQSALKNAVLLGMGGAGGQAFKKWSEVRAAAGERKYVVCNADESEPGTFKDRELLLRTPHLVVEGVLLAAAVLGAEQAYIYIRHEYEECIAAVREEIAWARQQRLCGDDILGSRVNIQLEVFVSPGGYICGEQTALIQAIEDRRAEPRNRPPELQTNGLWDMPTLVNNVETLAWAPAIVLHDAQLAETQSSAARSAVPDTDRSWYGSRGRPFGELAKLVLSNDADWQRRHGQAQRFPGLRMFSVSGDVNRPGVYEVENGITVGELLELAGGMRGGRCLKAVALSGPSGGFTPAMLTRDKWPQKLRRLLPPELSAVALADLQMHINYFRLWDLMLGAGIVVYADDANLVEQALACQRFYAAESCGKCVPCRIGSTKLAAVAGSLLEGRLSQAELAQVIAADGPVADLTFTMANTAICGLGTVAPNPLLSLITHFPAEVAAYTRR